MTIRLPGWRRMERSGKVAADQPASFEKGLRPSTGSRARGHAMSESENENKARNKEIAENEADRQTTGDIRVSGWAIAVAVVIGLAAVGWVLIHNN
jgi:uncharacterized protein HemX